MDQPFISLCMIVKDEETYLQRCLESFEGIYDELIVVDTGSGDRTVEIAGHFGARVERFEWCNDFAAARNYACGFARGEWIFMPDGDEYLGPAHICEKVVEMLRQAPDHLDKILIEQRSLLGNNDVLTILIDRLFRNRKELSWKYRIHEVLETPGGRTAITRDFYLNHDNALHSRDNMQISEDREQMYLRALALDARDFPSDPRPAFYLAGTLYGAGRHEEASDAYQRYFGLSEGKEPERRALAFRDAAANANKMGDRDQQRAYLFRSLEHDWRPPEIYAALADLAQAHENRDEAIHWLTTATSCKPYQSGTGTMSSAYGAEIHERLAGLYSDAGEAGLAKHYQVQADKLRNKPGEAHGKSQHRLEPSGSKKTGHRKGKKRRSKRKK
ncbi:MAG: glycosyltransferase family 2 protein [Deltaproteobacteria bacterium]|nr:glycosyltransferase family 2 protein [Deltaproteobacteria bacterium]